MKQPRQRLVLHRHLHHAEPEPSGSSLTSRRVRRDRTSSTRLPVMSAGPMNDVRARVLVIAVDDDEPWAHAEQRSARGFVGVRKAGSMSRELDRGADQRGGERVRREHEHGHARDVVIRGGTASRRGR